MPIFPIQGEQVAALFATTSRAKCGDDVGKI
jgi:hypothetical protein